MAEIQNFQNPNDEVFPFADSPLPPDSEESGIASKISELSKKGYSLLKENRVDYAIEAFSKILNIEDNNNYALVGLGDSERKRNHFKEAIEHYSKCLSCHPGNNYALFGLAP